MVNTGTLSRLSHNLVVYYLVEHHIWKQSSSYFNRRILNEADEAKTANHYSAKMHYSPNPSCRWQSHAEGAVRIRDSYHF